jgi:hypothetical protein
VTKKRKDAVPVDEAVKSHPALAHTKEFKRKDLLATAVPVEEAVRTHPQLADTKAFKARDLKSAAASNPRKELLKRLLDPN